MSNDGQKIIWKKRNEDAFEVRVLICAFVLKLTPLCIYCIRTTTDDLFVQRDKRDQGDWHRCYAEER